MKKLLVMAFVCISLLWFVNVQSVQALMLDDFTLYGSSFRIGNSISMNDSTDSHAGFYASNVFITNNLKRVSFDLTMTITDDVGAEFCTGVFKGVPYDEWLRSGWPNELSSLLKFVYGPSGYPGDTDPVVYSTSCGIDLTQFKGETISFGWTFNCFGSGTVVASNIEIQQTPEPSTMLLLGSGIAGLALWRRKKSA